MYLAYSKTPVSAKSHVAPLTQLHASRRHGKTLKIGTHRGGVEALSSKTNGTAMWLALGQPGTVHTFVATKVHPGPVDCPIGTPAVLGNKVAWVAQGVGCTHQLRLAGPHGSVRVTDRLFLPGPVSAFGGIVVPTRSQHHLLFFSSSKKSQTLLRVRNAGHQLAGAVYETYVVK